MEQKIKKGDSYCYYYRLDDMFSRRVGLKAMGRYIKEVFNRREGFLFNVVEYQEEVYRYEFVCDNDRLNVRWFMIKELLPIYDVSDDEGDI